MQHNPPSNDPFNPAALRLSQDFAANAGVKKLLTRIPVRKPTRHEFVRVHPDEDHRLTTMVLEVKADKEVYLVAPEMRDDLSGEAVPVTLFHAINRQGVNFLWHCRLPGADGRTNPWNQSGLEAAAHAARQWVRVCSDMDLGAYVLFEATDTLPEPEWPDLSLHDILRIAFKDYRIDSPEHPFVQRLRGRT